MRCAVAVAAIRAEPDEEAEQVTQALRGEPLAVEEQRGGWARVVTAYGYPGWLRAAELEPGAGRIDADATGTPVEVARTYLGAPYLWGGLTAEGIDCSGLVHVAHRRLGRLVPRDAWQQAEVGTAVAEPATGDLVLYGEERASVDHVAFWLGGGLILHATARDGLGVVEELEPEYLRVRRRGFVRL